MLIDTELRKLDAAFMDIEDAAIWEAEHPIDSIDGGNVQAPVGSPLAALIETLNGTETGNTEVHEDAAN